jgi:hypothetical protein
MTPDSVKASYRSMLDEVGESVLIRRYTGTGANRPKFDAEVRARVMEFKPAELVGTIQQGDRKLIVLADDLATAQMPLPLRKGDKAVVSGKELNIEGVDDNTRRIAGVLVAIELQVRG